MNKLKDRVCVHTMTADIIEALMSQCSSTQTQPVHMLRWTGSTHGHTLMTDSSKALMSQCSGTHIVHTRPMYMLRWTGSTHGHTLMTDSSKALISQWGCRDCWRRCRKPNNRGPSWHVRAMPAMSTSHCHT